MYANMTCLCTAASLLTDINKWHQMFLLSTNVIVLYEDVSVVLLVTLMLVSVICKP